MSVERGRAWREDFTRFFEEPTRERFRDVIRRHVGEQEYCDFKEAWPAFSKVARHILAMANSGGGSLVFGVAQNRDNSLEARGLEKLVDKAEIQRGVQRFLSSGLKFEVLDFAFEESEYPQIKGKKFRVIFVDDDRQHIPFVCQAHGDDIRECAIYVRRGTNSVEANHEDLQRLLNRRLETGYSTTRELNLQEHLAQLKILYEQMSKYYSYSIPLPGSSWYLFQQAGVSAAMGIGVRTETIENPNYAKEGYEAFIARMIEEKKKVIAVVLGVGGSNP